MPDPHKRSSPDVAVGISVYRQSLGWIQQAIRSVQAQCWQRWSLCLRLDGPDALTPDDAAALDAWIAARGVGPEGSVVGIDLNPVMRRKARANLIDAGAPYEFKGGRIEEIPVEDGSIDVLISNGVINLSFRKRRVMEEMFRVLKPGGRISVTDIVSAKQLSQDIVNDPNLWAS